MQKNAPMLKEEVDEEDIAKFVSKWTGIPVGRLLEGEAQKLMRMEERLRQRVVGQDDALSSTLPTRFAAAARDSPIRKRPIGSFIFWARPAWAKRNWRERSPNFCSTTKKR